MKPLRIGETVWYSVNGRWFPAVVVRKDRASRSYIVVAANSMHYRRNRKHLRKRPIKLASPEINNKFSSLNTSMNKNPFDISLPLICDRNDDIRSTSAQQSSHAIDEPH